ncbi:hypothetical protein AMTRI_Chr11g101240 [Amborella trichopoda]
MAHLRPHPCPKLDKALKIHPNPCHKKALRNCTLSRAREALKTSCIFVEKKPLKTCTSHREQKNSGSRERKGGLFGWAPALILKNGGREMGSKKGVRAFWSQEKVSLENGYVLRGCYGWNVRCLEFEENEMRRVAEVQAKAFHVPMPFFNDFFFHLFEADVLAGLFYKIRNSAPNRYACLVAEPEVASSTSQRRLVGVVDVTVWRDEAVLRYLEGAEEYLYVSGIAVVTGFRRRKVATALLKACDVLSRLWGFECLALRAYEDDAGARTLYSNAGYKVVSGDPLWLSTWIGRKRRILMIKKNHIM